jgi:hypothetical protein
MRSQTWQTPISSRSSSCLFSMVLSCPAQLAFQPLYCNAQFFDRRVRAMPLKCREISKMKATSASPRNRCVAISPALRRAPDRGSKVPNIEGWSPGSSSRMRVKWASGPRSMSYARPSPVTGGVMPAGAMRSARPAARIAASLRPLLNQIEATTSLEDIRGQGRDRVTGAGRQVQD